MKPFNLEEALAGKPVCTRDGRSVKIAGHNPDSLSEWTAVVGWVENRLNYWGVGGAGLGNYYAELDLFMVGEKHTDHRLGIVGCEGVLGETFRDSESAREALACYIQPARIVPVTIEWED
jgi:hypothetical protein